MATEFSAAVGAQDKVWVLLPCPSSKWELHVGHHPANLTVILILINYGCGHQLQCVGFPLTKQYSETLAGCPTVQLNSYTIYLETVSDPTG